MKKALFFIACIFISSNLLARESSEKISLECVYQNTTPMSQIDVFVQKIEKDNKEKYTYEIQNKTGSSVFGFVVGEGRYSDEILGIGWNTPELIKSPDDWSGRFVQQEEGPFAYIYWSGLALGKKNSETRKSKFIYEGFELVFDKEKRDPPLGFGEKPGDLTPGRLLDLKSVKDFSKLRFIVLVDGEKCVVGKVRLKKEVINDNDE